LLVNLYVLELFQLQFGDWLHDLVLFGVVPREKGEMLFYSGKIDPAEYNAGSAAAADTKRLFDTLESVKGRWSRTAKASALQT
jgi:hypothetical protein